MSILQSFVNYAPVLVLKRFLRCTVQAYYAAVLIRRVTSLARPSVRPSVRPVPAPTRTQKGVEKPKL